MLRLRQGARHRVARYAGDSSRWPQEVSNGQSRLMIPFTQSAGPAERPAERVHASPRDEGAQIRRVCRMTGVAVFALAGLRLVVDANASAMIAAGSMLAAVGIFASPELLRFGASVRGALWAAVLTGLAGLVFAMSGDGPSASAATPMVLLTPVVVAMTLGGRDTARAGGLSIAVTLCAFMAEGFGIIGAQPSASMPDVFMKCVAISAILLLQTRILGNFADRVSQTNRSLAKAREAAEAANIAKSQFLATASHELRTPLNGVIGMAQVMLTTQLSPKQRQAAEIMDSSAVSLLKILNDVFEATEINSGLFRVSSAPFDAAEVVEASVAAHEQAAWDKGLGLKLIIERAALGRYHGDAQRISQILGRLLENAIKFTDDGAVTIRLSRSGKGLTLLEVCDAGPGLSAEHQRLIFNQFQQADQSETRQFGGLGLGLATSRTLAELMGGALTVRSALGEGATFTLSLPLPRARDDALKAKLAG